MTTHKVALVLIACGASLAAQTPKQPQYKDRGEYDIYSSVLTSQNDANKQLQLLNTWKQKYPDTEFQQVRADLFAQDYLALNQPAQAIMAAQEALAINPKDATALIDIVRAAPYVAPVTPEGQKIAADAANALIDNWNDMKPAGIADADWSKAKNDLEPLARYTLGWAKFTRKDYAGAEAALKPVVGGGGNPLVQYGLANYWYGTALYGQHKVPEGLYAIARAIGYTGSGALDAASRSAADAFLRKAYAGYHGDDSGLSELLQLAAKNPSPPEGFTIESIEVVQGRQQAVSVKFESEHPDLALWRLIRTTLEGDGGAAYFDEHMKGALLPPQPGKFDKFKAKVVAQPGPKELLVAIDNEAGDAILAFATPVRGTIEPGLAIEFSGSPEGYRKEPYNVRFTVDVKDVAGLPARKR